MILILILYFSILFQGTNTFFNDQDDKYNRNIKTDLSTSNSNLVDWTRTWGGINNDEGYE